MTIKFIDNLIIGDTEWKASPFKFNVKELNFVGDEPVPPTPVSDNRLITSDDKVFITSDGNYFIVTEGE